MVGRDRIQQRRHFSTARIGFDMGQVVPEARETAGSNAFLETGQDERALPAVQRDT
jgi:hypothetical protein